MNAQPLVDFTPAARLALLAGVIALLPLSWVWLRRRGADMPARMAALTALTLFLTFDLVVFGAFTRLTDSGLGCPDWPGCYGHASPLGAQAPIHAAQTALPSGPVTSSKAWIEMIHRYLAMTVGVLIVALAAVGWRERRRLPISPWWPTSTLAWVVVQGLFGKYTVTLKLYPAVVTLHLLGALVLLVLLAIQREILQPQPLAMPRALRQASVAVMVLLSLQIALGGWVSSNYAVLACTDFPLCNGRWWPATDFAGGFSLLRELGVASHGGVLPFEALVAIHLAHRVFAGVLALAAAALAWRLWRQGAGAVRRFGVTVAALLLAQWASGLSNVVLDWPLAGALAHSGGAAALVLALTLLIVRGAPAQRSLSVRGAAAPA